MKSVSNFIVALPASTKTLSLDNLIQRHDRLIQAMSASLVTTMELDTRNSWIQCA